MTSIQIEITLTGDFISAVLECKEVAKILGTSVFLTIPGLKHQVCISQESAVHDIVEIYNLYKEIEKT